MAGGSVQPNSYVPQYGVPGPVQFGTIAQPPSNFNPGFGVGKTVGNATQALLGGGGQPQGPADSFSLQDYLRSLGLSGGDFGVDLPEAPDLTAGVQDQYGGVIDYLRRSIGRTENKGEKQDENLKEIYGAMANMSKQSGKVIAKQGRRTTKSIKKNYERLENRRDESIEKDTGAVARRLEELGISSALPASTERLMKESAQDHRLIARQEGRAVASSKEGAANWANYAKTGAHTARLEGAQNRATLSQNVADAVFGLQGQIAQSKAEKAAAMMQAQQAEYAMAADAAQAEQAAAMQKAGFAQQYQQMMMEQQAAQQGGGAAGSGEPPEGWDLVASILGNEAKQEQGINQRDASSALEQLQGFDYAPGYDEYGQPRELSMDQWTDQLRQQAESAGIDPNLYRAVMLSNIFQQTAGGGSGGYS